MSEGTEPPAVRLWKRVTEAQQERGWGIGELAVRAGVGRNTIPALRRNKDRPLTKTVRALARALDIPVKEAFELAGLDPETALESDVVAVGEATSDFGPDLEPEYSSQLEELLASLPEGRRAKLERMRKEEDARYQRQRREAHEDYVRSLGLIGEIAQLEISRDRKTSDEGDDE